MHPRIALATLALAAACSDENKCEGTDCPTSASNVLYVARADSLASFDLSSGDERPGTVQMVESPVDMQALEDRTLLINLTTRNEVLVIDGSTMLEEARISSTRAMGRRPVHSFISPERNGRRFYLALNDGMDNDPTTNSACLIDLQPSSSTYLKVAGEVLLGVGHHKASFSTAKDRVVISNISDCDNVISAYDYSDPANIQTLATLTSSAAGWTAMDPGAGMFNPRFCDPTYQRGVPPSPHGCATSKLSKKAYCNITASGAMASITVDADPPTFTIIPTTGSGGGYTLAHPNGRYLYTMQESPREGDGGVACQIGQVVITDAMTDTIAAEIPILYKGPGCTETLDGTAAKSANTGHSYFTKDGSRLYIPTAGGFMEPDARVDQLVILDTSSPVAPIQLASTKVGIHTGHSSGAMSGDGHRLFIVHGIDGTVSEIDTANGTVLRTLNVGASPVVIATFGDGIGPSEQTGPIK